MGERLGGRALGTPNKSTAKVREFLGGVFDDAFARPEMRQKLVEQIANLTIDTKLLTTLLAYYAGRPAVAVDHRVEGTLSLAQLIAGEVPADDSPDVPEPEE